jgi:hypothetical protein
MPFGILQYRGAELVPGTGNFRRAILLVPSDMRPAVMNDQSDLPPDLHDQPTEQLKHGTGKYSHIILVPQPSDDPNDPLNVNTSKAHKSAQPAR